jgi:hypothetical protein
MSDDLVTIDKITGDDLVDAFDVHGVITITGTAPEWVERLYLGITDVGGGPWLYRDVIEGSSLASWSFTIPADTFVNAENGAYYAEVLGAGVDSFHYFDIQLSRPAVTITLSDTVLKLAPTLVTFQFSEAVTGFTLANVQAGLGTLSNFTQVDADTYTAILTPASQTEGSGVITVDTNWTDIAGDHPASSAASPGYVVDNKGPTAGTLEIFGLVDTGTIDPIPITSDSGFTLRVSADPQDFSGVATRELQHTVLGGIFAPTSSTINFLADGVYFFREIYTDTLGNTSSTNVLEVIIDTTPPPAGTLAFANLGPIANGVTADHVFDLVLSGPELGAQVAYEISTDDLTWTPTDAAQLGLADGTYHFRAVATDAAGNSADSNELAITLVSSANNHAPVVSGPATLKPIAANSGADVITQAALLTKASDDDSPALAAINLQIAAGLGTLTDNHDGTWSYTPQPGDSSNVTFSYQVTDGIASVDTTARLDITPPPEAPPLPGTNGDDTFTAPTGDASFDALHGIDTIVFDFKLTDAKFTFAGNAVIVDTQTSHTVLRGFEIYKFTDGTVNTADGDPLVDDLSYYVHYHDVWNAHVDADTHYHTIGWREGRDPDLFFPTWLYLSLNPAVRAAGIDPLQQFEQGGWKTTKALPNFDLDAYLADNPGVKAVGLDPLVHFLSSGLQDGRQAFSPDVLAVANGFDYMYYLTYNPDVLAARPDPFVHYETIGWKEGRNPNAYFDTAGYLSHYADVAAAGVNPLDQYHQTGWQEGRDPSPNFDTKAYLAANPDVAAAHIDPLAHFLQHGLAEGRHAFADGVWG